MRTCFLQVLAAACACIAWSGRAQAQESALALLPAKAPIVVQVNGFDRAKQRLAKLLGNAIPDLTPRVMKQINDGLDEAFDGRDLKAIVKDAHLFGVLPDLSSLGEDLEFAVVVPVTGYKDFVDSFLKETERKSLKKEENYDAVTVEGRDDPLCLVDRKTHVVIASSPDTAKLFGQKQGGLDKALDAGVRRALLAPDAAVYVNMAAINETYGASIKAFKTLIDLAMQQGGGAQGLDKKQTEMVAEMLKGLFRVVEDCVAVVLGVEFRPEGLNLRLQGHFGDGTDTGKFLAGQKPGTLAPLASLPSGQMTYSGAQFGPNMAKAVAKLISQFTVGDATEGAKKAIEEGVNELAAAGMESSFQSHALALGGLDVAFYKDPAKAVSASLKMLQALTASGEVGSVPLKEKPEIKPEAETIGAFKFHYARLKFDLEKAVAGVPEQMQDAMRKQFERTVGNEMKMWFGTDGKSVLTVQGHDWPAAKALVDEYLKGQKTVGKEEAFTLTRRNLPAEATGVLLLDTGRTLSEVMRLTREVLQAVPGIPAIIPELGKPTGGPAYMGFALVLRNDAGSIDYFLPTTAVQQIRKMFSPLIERDD